MPPAGRIGDKARGSADAHGCPGCPHPTIGPAILGSGNVNINGRPAVRVGDIGIHAPCCGMNMWTAQVGAAFVFINGKAAHRLNDLGQSCGGIVTLMEGSPNVIIGDLGGGGGGAGAPGMQNIATGPSGASAGHEPTAGGASASGAGGAAGGDYVVAASPAVSAPRPARPPAIEYELPASVAQRIAEERQAAEEKEPELDWVEIELLDWDGTPMADEPVKVELADGSVREARLDGSGRLRLDDIPPGTCRVWMPDRDQDSWLPPPPIARPGADHWIGLEVLEADGRPLAGEPIAVTLPDGSVRELKLDAQGRARLDRIPAGTCKVAFPERDLDAFEAPAALPRVTGDAWVEIALLDDRGAPAAGEPVEIELPDGSLRKEKLDARGRVRLDGIPAGICVVRLPERDEDAFAPPPPVELETAPGLDWIEIELLDSDGRPAAGEPFRIRLPDDSVRELTLDARGRARLEGLPAGNCKVVFTERDEDSWQPDDSAEIATGDEE